MGITILKPTDSIFSYRITSQERIAARVEYPPEGGIYVYYKGHPFPEKGFPHELGVACIDPAKRAIISPAHLFKKSKIACFWAAVIAISPGHNKLLYALVDTYSSFLDNALRKIYFSDPKTFCKSGRELYRAGMVVVEKLSNNDEQRAVGKRLVMAMCTIWENDNSYRHRGQDSLPTLDKKLAETNPGLALWKLFELLVGRELDAINLGGKWKALKWPLLLVAKNKMIKNILKIFFAELNLDKIKQDDSDIYWSYHRQDYNMGGLPLLERLKLKEKLAVGRASY